MQNLLHRLYCYDIESYPNFFSLTATHIVSGAVYVFEISERKNDVLLLVQWIQALQSVHAEQVGYNNVGYDYVLLHFICTTHPQFVTAAALYGMTERVINSDDKFEFSYWDNEIIIPQIDLYRIHHFDNVARATSLKALEFAMRSLVIEDLPFPPGTWLTWEQMNIVLTYNKKDVDETIKFFHKSMKEIEFRVQLSEEWGTRLLNKNDTQIGVEYFKRELKQRNVNVGKSARTYRDIINLNDVIFPYIQFNQPAFQEVLNWLKSQSITETKGVFTKLKATIAGFDYDFGTGGLHGSINAQRVVACDYWMLKDLDVKSYYPNVAIKNRLAPAHLGDVFCDIYEMAYNLRNSYDKGTLENALYKLALNGIFGKSNSEYSFAYDPQFAMSVTINGQLLLCMLAESLLTVPNLSMVQVNTDGVTIRFPRCLEYLVDAIAAQWEQFTCLELEGVEYSQMCIRDVNNYVAIDTAGKLKPKGAFVSERGWSQKHSGMIIPKAAQAYLETGIEPRDFILNHTDLFDFVMLAKVPRSSKLLHGDKYIQGTSRYFISTEGESLTKEMPPTTKQVAQLEIDKGNESRGFAGLTDKAIKSHKKKYPYGLPLVAPQRFFRINSGYVVQVCNDITTARVDLINYDFYIAETEKLIKSMRV